MSEAASWYYVGTYGQLGPLTTEQFDEFIEAGVIERTTYVWRPGMPDWVPASVVINVSFANNAAASRIHVSVLRVWNFSVCWHLFAIRGVL